MTRSRGGLDLRSFTAIFTGSPIPMLLVDRSRRSVAVNEAVVDLFQCRREDIIGRRIDATGPDSSGSDEKWEELLARNELHAKRVVRRADGTPMRIAYAAHAANVEGQWLALGIILSAHAEPNGEELIGRREPPAAAPGSSLLTRREREIVRRVALGAGTRKIASDLFLSPATVRSHVRNAMVKTHAHTRAQLVAIALCDRPLGE